MKALSLSLRLGATADIPIRVESDELTFAPITAMTKSAPVNISSTANGIPDGWRAAVLNAGGMTELNAAWNAIRDSDFRRLAVIDVNTIAFPGVTSAGFRTYTTGGELAYYTPKDLAGYTGARMDIKRAVGGTVLASLNTTDGTIEIDAPNSAVWLHVTPTTLVDLTAGDYVFDIELIDGTDVLALCSADSVLHLLPEVTTST
ncbi:MAG: hypothetical protein V5B38_04870 [Candidatus Accumulibacter propinquus]|jgi:hypothetical protein